MKLFAAARHFDRLPVYDAYTGSLLFHAQFDLFDDAKRDAVNVMRRTLSAAPTVTMPSRLALRAAGLFWVVGQNQNKDTFLSSVIRTKYTVQQSVGLASIRTPGQVILNAGGTTAYAGLAWMKDWKEVEYNSKVYPYYEAYFSATEGVAAGHFLELTGKIMRVRGTYLSEAGFLVAESDDLGAARVTITYAGPNSYNPVTDAYTAATQSVPGLLVRYAANFDYEQPSAEKRQEGDQVVLIRQAAVASPKIGDSVTFSGRTYSVISISSESDCWNLTVRP